MSIADIKSGGWAEKERLTSAQMNDARAELLKCVDGVGGGTYTPSSPIAISDLEATDFLVTTPTVAGTGRYKYTSRSVTRHCIDLVAGAPEVPARWTLTGARPWWEHTSSVGTNVIWWQVRLPVGSTLTAVTGYVIAGSGHGALPTTMPTLSIYTSTFGSTTPTLVGTGTDASATVPEYEAGHTIAISGMSHTVLSTVSYWLRLATEGLTNGAVGLSFRGATATVTMTEQDEWVG